MRKIISLIVLSIFSIALFATGMPVFDAQGLVYNILSYSEEAQQVINFAKNVEREIQQYEKLYKQISEGKILDAVNTVQGRINTLERNLDKYVDLGNIGSSIFDISQSANDWINHLEDPDYFLEMITEVNELAVSSSGILRQHEEDMQQSRQEDLNQANNKTDDIQLISSSESQSEKAAATYNETVDGNIANAEDRSNSAVNEKAKQVVADAEALQKELEGYQLRAEQNVAEKNSIKDLEDSIPSIDISLTPSYAE